MQLAILAAGFTPGEADQLRRAMAAWRRRGSLGPFEDRLINGMLMRGYTRDFAERVFAQIQGFGEYGFPESHAASFALLVYVSCWLKRHHPDAFLAALLNSQPMGFYAPAQLVRDARAHGVEVRAVDVQHSTVGSSLEPPPGASSGPLWAVRLGLNRIAQLPEEAMQRIVQARLELGRFQSVEDLAQRAALSRTDLQALAAANALEGLAGHRHAASWVAAGHEPMKGVLSPSQVQEPRLAPDLLPEPTEASSLVADYASLGLTLGRHPIALIRDQLRSRYKSIPALELRQMPSDRLARATGLVTHRQRPGTAKGVVFMTLEDETGSINLIVWPDVLARFKQACLQGQVITAYGRWQTQHLVSLRIEDHTALLAQALGGVVQRRSRDFH